MPAVTHTAALDAPTEQVWNFVRSFDNWAAFIDGYQDHEVLSDTRSTWSIKGTAGAVTRTVKFDVEITEWIEGDRVEFALIGRSEPLTGNGRFLTRAPAPTAASEQGVATQQARPVAKGRLARLLDRLGRWLHARILQSRQGMPARSDASSADRAAPSGASTELTFDLELVAGGMTGPMINPMMVPMLTPVAENLANRLREAITHQVPATGSVTPDA